MLGLGIGLTLGGGMGGRPAPDILCEAVAKRLCVTANDGDIAIKIAPHIVYKRTKKETRTVDAVLVERNGKPVNHATLRSYTVAELSDIAITEDGFTVDPDFDPQDIEYSRGAFCVLEAANNT